jgi:ABC-type lipoprotein export system ATPase subunit
VSLIHLEGLSKVYRVGDQEIRALDGVNLRIDEGEFIAIIGSSGSGKSTLMHLLGCLDTPTAGRMEICGKDLAKASSDELARVRNKEIGFVFQAFNLLPKLNRLRRMLDSVTVSQTARPSSAAGSASALPLPAPSSTTRAFSLPTNPRVTSTPPRGA